ncbi:MAG: hypothetical protein BGP06_03890 [Rhizobiales bacterium 65-9]|nr:NAD(P)/FAD-dependent oxidoreductase [Hyphomicrobiales bacterium]OJY36064.1 MAG: hypothetical protein BGP06_03890 [Rhizobiales bacterium 65-9]
MSEPSPIIVDLCVIGAGAAGIAAATTAAAFGVSVALVEKGAMGGGRISADIPLAALRATMQRLTLINEAAGVSVAGGPGQADFAAAAARAKAVAALAARDDSEERLTAMGVRVMREPARFIDDRTIRAGATTIRARRFILATGSAPDLSIAQGLAGAEPLTVETMLDLPQPPQRLLILGGDPSALELAQLFRRFGSDVRLLTPRSPIEDHDPEMTRIVLQRLLHDGVRVTGHARVESIGQTEGGISTRFSTGPLRDAAVADRVLIATERRPRIDGLDLAKAGVAFDRSGVTVDAGLRTSSRRIYAIGDCAAGQPRSVHAAIHHARLVVRSALFRLPFRIDASMIPRFLSCDPEIAACGLMEDDARRMRSDVVTLRWPFAENDRARADNMSEGHVKIVATRRGRILGAALVGRGAGDMLPLWSFAITTRRRLSDIAGLVAPYPTLSEISTRAAIGALAPLTRSPQLRRVIALLRRLG